MDYGLMFNDPWLILMLLFPQIITTFFNGGENSISLARQKTFSAWSYIHPIYKLCGCQDWRICFQKDFPICYYIAWDLPQSPIMILLMLSWLTQKLRLRWILYQLLLEYPLDCVKAITEVPVDYYKVIADWC